MQTAFNRQAIHGEVNPLFKKFVHEGDNPSTYIPADKRRQIYNYMSKVNILPFESKQLDIKICKLLVPFDNAYHSSFVIIRSERSCFIRGQGYIGLNPCP